MKNKPKKEKENDDEEWEEVDDHEKDVFDKDGYFDVPDEQAQISKNDENILKMLQKKREETGKSKPKEAEGVNLADMIMQKLKSGNWEEGEKDDKHDKKELKYEELKEGVASKRYSKLVAADKSLGTILR